MSELYNYAVKPSQQPEKKKHLTKNLDNKHYSDKSRFHTSVGTEMIIIKLAGNSKVAKWQHNGCLLTIFKGSNIDNSVY
jgi:hypothetical protein